MELLITGATGFTGGLFIKKLAKLKPHSKAYCLVRHSSNYKRINSLTLNISYIKGDSNVGTTWEEIIQKHNVLTIIHIASIRHVPVILDSFNKTGQTPRLIIIGTTGVYSNYNQYSQIYKDIESQLEKYSGSYCLLRPTMIYGSERDKNLHKLIRFCDRYGVFPVFGSGDHLVQPVHADDLAQAILTALQRPNIQGAYDLSGGSVVTFRELLTLVEKLLAKQVGQISLPLNAGVWSATILENLLKERSPVRREQILRLQEDKAYPHDAAQRDLDFFPRTLEEGLRQEVELMRSLGMISS